MDESPSSEVDWRLARKAVERGWVTQEQVEVALQSYDQSRGTRLLAHLRLTPDQIRELEVARPLPPEAREATQRVGRYLLVNHLRSGGMGSVYRAWDADLGRWVALKFLKAAEDETARSYFRREAELAAGLDHPHIARIFEIGEHEGSPFLAMQYIEGETLETAKGRMSLEEKLRTARTVAEAVRFAHASGVIHRDLKPANVMVDRAGGVFVLDFGLAKRTKVDDQTLGASGVVGTPSYMAPEQARGKATAQSDVYGIGAILYELVTGRPPFTGGNATEVLLQVVTAEPIWPRRLAPATPQDLEAIILKALEKDSRRRYADVSRLIEDLDAFQAGNPLRHARRPTIGYVLGKKVRKQPALWALGVALAFALMGGAAFGTVGLVQRRKALRAQAVAEGDAAAAALARERAEREGRERAERTRQEADRAREQAEHETARAAQETRRAGEQTGYLFSLRSRQEFERGRRARSAVLSADAFAANPSQPPRAHAAGLLDSGFGLRAILFHEKGATQVRFSPDGERVATAGMDGTVRLWDLSGTPVGEPLRHDDVVLDLAFSPDGSTLASAGRDGTIRFGNTALRHGGVVTAVIFTPEGLLLSGGSDKSVREWNPEAGRVFEHAEPVYQIRLGGDRMLVRGAGGQVKIWNRREGTLLLEWAPPSKEGRADAVALSPDGARFAAESSTGVVRLWDSATGKELGEAMSHRAPVWSIAFSPDGKRLVTGSLDETARVWDGETGKPAGDAGGFLRSEGFAHDQAVIFAAFSPDGKRLLTGSVDRTARLWSLRDGDILGFEMEHEDWVESGAFSPDGRVLATLARGGAVRLWNVAGREPAWEATVDGRSISEVALSPDGKKVVAASYQGGIRILDAETGKTLASPAGHSDQINALRFDLDGARFATVSHDQTARIWDAATGNPIGDPIVHDDYVGGVEFSPDRKRLMTLSWSGIVRLWDGGTLEREIRVEDRGMISQAFLTPDGKEIYTGGSDRAVRVWNVETGKELRAWTFESDIELLRMGPDGRRLLVAFENGTARLWDPTAGTPVGEVMKFRDPVKAAAFSPDSRLVATGPWRWTVYLWDAETGRPTGGEIHHNSLIQEILFTPDSRWVITATDAGAVQVWDPRTGGPIGAPFPHPGMVTAATLRSGRVFVGTNAGLLRAWDLGFLEDATESDALRLRVQRRTGLRLNEASEIELIPPEERP